MDLTNALWITLIGMGLVFIAILLLWGLMALLVRITAEPEEAETPPEAQPAPALEVAPEASLLLERKRRAAAAAVAFALAAQAQQPRREPQPTGALSPWQAVNRAGRIGLQTVASRKKVVR